ncbi:MAG TPA: hypothetical protein PKL65_11725, partial [Bacteroidales bacterium]|nr:hypothetical protein [Bacteroidales bacterium]
KKPMLNLSMVAFVLIMMGYFSYAVVMIRSKADPPMDENNPENAYTLMKYLNRAQYGTTPLLTGYYFNAPAVAVEKGDPVYYPKNGKYVKIEGSPNYKYDDRFKKYLVKTRAMAIDMETATIFTVGFANEIPTGALLLVSDQPMISTGIKTSAIDKNVTDKFVEMHLKIGIDALREIKNNGISVKHLRF